MQNQIDYLLVNRRFRNKFTSDKTYPGANIESDLVDYQKAFDRVNHETMVKILNTHVLMTKNIWEPLLESGR